MAKLRQGKTDAAAPPPAPEVAGQAQGQPQPPAPVTPAPAAAAPGPVPFGVEAPGAPAAKAAAGPRPNLVQKRQEKIQAAIAGKTFVFKEERRGQQFNCFCGASGKNAIVLTATDGAGVQTEVLSGADCLKYTGVTLPKAARQPRAAGSPGINKQQKFAEKLAAFKA